MVEDRMDTGLTSAHKASGFSVLYHVFPRKQCILCSLVLFSLLPYITLCYIDMEIFSGDLIT